MSEKSLELCVLSNPYLTEYEVESLNKIVINSDAEISLVAVNEPASLKYDPEQQASAVNKRFSFDAVKLFFEVFDRERWWTFVITERKLAELFGLTPSSRQIHVSDVSVFDDAEIFEVTPQFDGNWMEFPSDAVSKIGQQSDLAIRYGFGLIKGDILEAPSLGVLSFHPADIRNYRGMGPPQAYLDGQNKMGLTLQRITNEIDAGEIVAYAETDISGCFTLWDIYQSINELQVDLLTAGIQNLQDPEFSPTVPNSLGPYHSTKKRQGAIFTGKILIKDFIGYIKKVIV